jgi:hypothetical protein
MNYFCTLFDSHYLTRGLALYDSLASCGGDFELAIYCFDEKCLELLEKMSLLNVRLVPFSDFETQELAAVKTGRTRGEFCWTCTPHVIRDVFARFSWPEVTYLDSDLYFFGRPEILFDEFRKSGGSILITEHRYAPEYDQTLTSGKYCVQFITFKDDVRGRTALEWWGKRCLEWCYARFEDGKFGDQKYLDDWTTRFEGVHVLGHLGGGVAPWNMTRYRISNGPKVEEIPIIFFHFHNLKWFADGKVDLCGESYRMDRSIRELIYRPYVEALDIALKSARKLEPEFRGGLLTARTHWRDRYRDLKRRIKGNYWFLKTS